MAVVWHARRADARGRSPGAALGAPSSAVFAGAGLTRPAFGRTPGWQW